jgi:Holliday junction resolvase RusA-like endonuclease
MDWIRLADCETLGQFALNGKPQTIKGPYELILVFKKPDNRRRDLDNLVKVVSDYLSRIEIIEDDRYCQRIESRWATGQDKITSGCVVAVKAVKP